MRLINIEVMILPVHRRQRRRGRCVRLGGRPGRGETGPGSRTYGRRTPSVRAGRRTGRRRACSSANNTKQLLPSCAVVSLIQGLTRQQALEKSGVANPIERRYLHGRHRKVGCVLDAEATA